MGDAADGGKGDQGGSSQQQQRQPTTSNVFPSPPVYYRSYGKNAAPKHPLAVSLDPPKIPEGVYMAFGEFWNPDEKPRTLKDEGREQLFDDPPEGQEINYAAELSKVCKLALEKYTGFLDVLGDMNINMTDSRKKAEEFETVFVNLLYLVNQLRPAQGRQLLINMMKTQLERRRETTANLRRLIQEGEQRIRETADSVKQNASAEEL